MSSQKLLYYQFSKMWSMGFVGGARIYKDPHSKKYFNNNIGHYLPFHCVKDCLNLPFHCVKDCFTV